MPPIDFEASRGVMNPMAVPEPGFYKARIEKAEMRMSNKTSKMYLNMQYKLRDNENRSCGSVFDGIFDPGDSTALKFKLGQFMRAVGLEALKKGELTDIMKLVVGKELCVDVKRVKDLKGRDKAEVEPFLRGGYAPIAEWPDCYARDGGDISQASPQTDDDLPFITDNEPPKPAKAKAAPPPPPAEDDEF